MRGKRQTEHGYDTISAPLPAVVAVSDAINEPRYPSLKGIMGAKTKPQETVSLADLGVAADARRRGGREDGRARDRRARLARRLDHDRGRRVGGRRRSSTSSSRGSSFEGSWSSSSTTTARCEKGGLGVLSKAASLGEAVGVVLGEARREVAAGAGAYGAAKVYVVRGRPS